MNLLRLVAMVLLSAGLISNSLMPVLAASGPELAQTPGYTNPVYRHNAPDPSVIRSADGTFYAFTTQSFYDNTKVNIPILQSSDLFEWSLVGDAFPVLPDWALRGEDADTWAPHVLRHDGKYYLYFAARSARTRTMGIGVATAEHPEGPWTAKRRPLMTGPRYTTIDPFVLRTKGGKLFIYWGSAGEPLRMQQLAPDGFSLVGESTEVLYPSRRAYEGLIEASWIVHRKDHYYLFYSGDRCCYAKAHYAVLVARSTSRGGPFKKYRGNPIVEANEEFKAPGHISTIPDAAGVCWMLYHAMDANEDSGFRYLMLDRIGWRDGWPRINGGNGPSSTARVTPDVSEDTARTC
ncbi:MAG: glycoside hydrolase family 43 protein [Actinomycetota bacterium]